MTGCVSSILGLQADLMRGLLISAHKSLSFHPQSVTVSLVAKDGCRLLKQPSRIADFATKLAGTYAHRPVGVPQHQNLLFGFRRGGEGEGLWG